MVSTARTAGLTAQEAFDAAKNIIGDLAITQHAHKYPQAVSSAERKLFALACALCVKRELLIIHSPLEDVSGQAATLLLRKLVTFARDGAGVLVLTEQPEVVEGICDRVLFISAGEVVAEDTPQNLCATCETDEVLLVPRGMPNTAQLGVGQHKFIKSVRHTERGFELELEGGQANLAILLKTLEERGIELEAMTFVRSRLAAAFEKAAGGRT
ncbi:MAG: hypothetical protein U5N86_12585 [Planctomycetota bacterium]|nr:hypothetical protein [Planctomycetota bacterium]